MARDFPGKKAFINDTIEELRANFRSIIGEIQRLIDASKFRTRLPSPIGSRIASSIPLMPLIKPPKSPGKRSASPRLERFPGKKAFINDTIEELRANFRSIIGEIQRLIEVAGSRRASR
jgi:methyl-accepting chemotaxis protein